MDFLQYQFTQITLVAGICTLFFLMLQLLYYFFVYGKVAFFDENKKKQKHTESEKLPPVSVVVAAKNEEYHLKQNLVTLLEQDYPQYEVIVVNDASTDESVYVLKALSKIYTNLKVVNLVVNVNKFKGKKFPLSIGIKSAKYEHIIVTCAECEVLNDKWLSTFASCFTAKKTVLLGYGAYKTEKTLLNKLIQYDTVTKAMNYMGFALCGVPYMGVGRNLGYTKKSFYSVGGFTKHYHVVAGDDDMFVNQIANKQNTAVVLNRNSFTHATPKHSFREWFIQKRRELSTFKYYKSSHKMLLSILPWSIFLFYAGIIILLLNNFPWQYVVLFILLKYVLQVIIYYKAGKVLEVKGLYPYAPLFEIYFLFLNSLMRLKNLLSRKS